MKASYTKYYTLLMLFALISFNNSSSAQNILLVNDNNNIVLNTDTLVSAMNHTTYSTYHYWSVPDSAGTTPSAAYMATFDLVIWYCSTDGVGLSFWNGTGTAGNPAITTYAASGKPLWIIGLDILYQKYTEGSVFTAGEFPKDYMGLTSYDVQSYIDDTSTGCPEIDRISTASALFPAKIQWQFSTLWYIDGCTPNTGTLNIYQMGPSGYVLNGRKCMFHNHTGGKSVMSTFFDPALIDSFGNRINFMQKGIQYLLSGVGVKSIASGSSFTLYPNPATTEITLEINSDKINSGTIELYDAFGKKVKQQDIQLVTGVNTIKTNIGDIAPGIYFVRVSDVSGETLYTSRVVKQ